MKLFTSLNNRGFSLVGLLTGIAILSIVLIASAYVVVQTKTVEVRFDMQAELDRAHLLSLQKSRSVSFLRRHLKLNPNPNDNYSPDAERNYQGGAQNTALIACLAKTGTNCLDNANVKTVLTDVEGASEVSTCSQGAGCSVNSTVQYRAICSSNSACDFLEVEFTTSFNPGGIDQGGGQSEGGGYSGGAGARRQMTFRDRKNTVKLPGALFASSGNVTFGCTANQVMSGINFQTLQAICQQAAPRNCAGNAPIQGYASGPGGGVDCPTLVSRNCNTGTPGQMGGMRTVGLFNTQAECRM